MAKSASNILLGELVKRDENRPHCWPSLLKPNASGEYLATIVAVWIEENVVRCSVVDPLGNNAELWLSHVVLVGRGRQ